MVGPGKKVQLQKLIPKKQVFALATIFQKNTNIID
jgi:hypothetical protein